MAIASSAPRRHENVAAQSARKLAWSCQRCGGVEGQGAGACCGAAVIGAGALAVAGFGRAADGLAPGFVLGAVAGFLTCLDDGGAGVSSTTTGFGRNPGAEPVIVIGSMVSLSG